MPKKINSLKMFLTAVATFMAVELADSPLRTLTYLSVFVIASSNMWIAAEEKLQRK